MTVSSLVLDKRQPRGIIIRSGAPPLLRLPFWAYLWGEAEEEGACAGPRGGPRLEPAPASDGSSPQCRASP